MNSKIIKYVGDNKIGKTIQSFVAMFVTWGVCLLLHLVWSHEWYLNHFPDWYFMFWGFYVWLISVTGFVAVAWLLVTFPINLLVPITSRLRQPKKAVALGMLFGFLFLYIIGIILIFDWRNVHISHFFEIIIAKDTYSLLIFATIGGGVAGWMLSNPVDTSPNVP